MGAAAADAVLDPLRQFRDWASVLFALLGAVALIAMALVLPSTSPPQTTLVLVAGAVGAGILFAVALAAGRGDGWAVRTIVPICLLLIGAGLLRTVAAFSRSEISVPLEVLGAIAVLSRPHAPEAMPSLTRTGRRAVWLAVGGLVVSQVLPYAASPVLASQLFGAKADDLALRMELDCRGAGGSPAPVTARASWVWTRDVLFAPPDDGILIDWSATTGEGQGTVVLATQVSDPSTMAAGNRSGATDTLLDPYRSAGGQGVDVGISRSGSQLEDGWVEVDIETNDVPPDVLEFRAVYAHGDRWVRWVRWSEPAFCP